MICIQDLARYRALDPTRVNAYLATQPGWTVFDRVPLGRRWLTPDDAVVIVPHVITADYARRLYEVVNALTRQSGGCCCAVLDALTDVGPGEGGQRS